MFKQSSSVARKLILVLASSITVVLAIAAFGLSSFLSNTLEQKALESLQANNRMVIEMIDTYNRSLEQTVERLGRVFSAIYHQPFTLDANGVLHHGSDLISAENTLIPDRFTEQADAAATILTRKGNDFERTSTSIKDANGKRAAGLSLGPDHPAVAHLLKGEAFTGKARMLGRDFMTRYLPIKDRNNQVIGAFFVGLDFSDGLVVLKKKILAMKIGQTGYVYALDLGKNKGDLTIHPAMEGKSLLGAKDSRGVEFVAQMMEKKDGVIQYFWKNPEDSGEREKVVAFNQYQDWNWLIASGSYLDEFNAEGKTTARGLLLLTSLLIPIVVVLVWWSARRWVSRPLEDAVEVAKRVAEGDFTSRIEIRSSDEIGNLMHAFGQMQMHLANTIRDVRTTVSSVAGDAEQLRASAQTVAAGSQEQSDAAASMAASVEQMSASIDMISQHAEDAKSISRESERVSRDSSDTIQQAVAAMTRISETVKSASGTVETLGREINSVSAIAGVIKDIADQTNLLALNAAIEAARAGEQGRGFAVVADEVRKLAERTTKSTHEITEMIARIQTGADDAVVNMNRGADEVNGGVELAAMADQAIHRIRQGAARVLTAIEGISDAIREQSIASTTVAKGLETIAQMTESNNAEAHNTACASKALQSLASELHDNVARFRV
ncbi:MAG: methyl-accepting chemotaxis protein [Azonexus sp.]|nr:methyl-accepting chemotaxis protein [Azonexus sp.]